VSDVSDVCLESGKLLFIDQVWVNMSRMQKGLYRGMSDSTYSASNLVIKERLLLKSNPPG
jgi:hypothetical protein